MKETPENTKIDDNYSTEIIPASNSVIEVPKNNTLHKKQPAKRRLIHFFKNACSILEVFTKKPPVKCKNTKIEDNKYSESPTLTVICITIFLVILVLNAILDVIKVKEEEKARRKENPDGLRRQSLSEFANKKTLRRDSSKFSLHLFQIAESAPANVEEKKTPQTPQVNAKPVRPYTRGDSTNSYLSERRSQRDGVAPFCSANESPNAEQKMNKRQSVSKLFGMFK